MPKEKKLQPAQHQRRQPGCERKMNPRPQAEDVKHRGSGKLQGKVAIINWRRQWNRPRCCDHVR
jgi:hypothetical protein